MAYPDINGDGLADFAIRSDQGIKIRLNKGDGTFNQEYDISTNICANGWNEYGACNDQDNYKNISYLDINSDGKSDLIYRSDNQGM